MWSFCTVRYIYLWPRNEFFRRVHRIVHGGVGALQMMRCPQQRLQCHNWIVFITNTVLLYSTYSYHAIGHILQRHVMCRNMQVGLQGKNFMQNSTLSWRLHIKFYVTENIWSARYLTVYWPWSSPTKMQKYWSFVYKVQYYIVKRGTNADFLLFLCVQILPVVPSHSLYICIFIRINCSFKKQ